MISSASLSDLLKSSSKRLQTMRASIHLNSQEHLSQSSSSSSFLTYRKKGYSFGSSKRTSLMTINISSPSAKYQITGSIQQQLHKKKGPSISIGRTDSVEKANLSYFNRNLNPGPGTYESVEIPKHVFSIKIGNRNNQTLKIPFLNEKVIQKNPGPGFYNQKIIKIKGGKLATKSIRFQCNKENIPGPGAYNSTNLDLVSSAKNKRIN